MKKEECKQVIRKAGKALLKSRDLTIEEKTDFKNLVTDYDKRTQSFLIENLGALIPQAGFYCEENNVKDTSEKYTFIIDPIDGTSNFIHHYNVSAISVALAQGSTLLWGIVYNPFTDELYEAEKGKGAFLNGRPIHVNNYDIAHSLVGFGTSPYYEGLQPLTFTLAAEVLQNCIDIRRSGSAALDLCYTARGSYGLFFELEQQAWDFAAAFCILQEAGGKLINFHGETPDFTKKSSIIAGNAANVDMFYNDFVKKHSLPEALA